MENQLTQKWGLLSSVKGKLWLTVSVSAFIALILWGALFYVSSTAQKNSDAIAKELTKAQAMSDGLSLLQQMNAPANNVLETWDYDGERLKFGASKDLYDQQAARMESLLANDPLLASRYEIVKGDVR